MLEYNQETASEHALFIRRDVENEALREQYQDSLAPHFKFVKEMIKKPNYEFTVFRNNVRSGLAKLEAIVEEYGSVASTLYGSQYYQSAFRTVAKELMAYRIDDLFELDVTHYLFDDKRLYDLLKKTLETIERPSRFGFSPFTVVLSELDQIVATTRRGDLRHFFDDDCVVDNKLELMRLTSELFGSVPALLARCGRIERQCVRNEESYAEGAQALLKENGVLQSRVLDLEEEKVHLEKKVALLEVANELKNKRISELVRSMKDLQHLVEVNHRLMEDLTNSPSKLEALEQENQDYKNQVDYLTRLLINEYFDGVDLTDLEKQVASLSPKSHQQHRSLAKPKRLNGRSKIQNVEGDVSPNVSQQLPVPFNSPNRSLTKQGSGSSSGEHGLFANTMRKLQYDDEGIAKDPGSYSPTKGSELLAN